MIVGVPTEVKIDEYRVSLLPVGAEELNRAGHKVLVSCKEDAEHLVVQTVLIPQVKRDDGGGEGPDDEGGSESPGSPSKQPAKTV